MNKIANKKAVFAQITKLTDLIDIMRSMPGYINFETSAAASKINPMITRTFDRFFIQTLLVWSPSVSI